MVRDLIEKRAAYINKNNELMQEFGFAHSDTLMKENNILWLSIMGSLWKGSETTGKDMERFTTTNASIISKDTSLFHRTSHRNQTYSL